MRWGAVFFPTRVLSFFFNQLLDVLLISRQSLIFSATLQEVCL